MTKEGYSHLNQTCQNAHFLSTLLAACFLCNVLGAGINCRKCTGLQEIGKSSGPVMNRKKGVIMCDLLGIFFVVNVRLLLWHIITASFIKYLC